MLKRLFQRKQRTTEIGWTWMIGPGSPAYNLVSGNFDAVIREAWRGSALVYACVHRVASSAAQVSLKVYVDGAPAPSDHPLARLIASPNPYMGEYDLWYTVIAYQKLAGLAAFEKVRNRAGQVVELWPLRPDYLQVDLGSDGRPQAYIYRPPAVPESQAVRLEPRDVLTFALFDPEHPFKTWSPVLVAAKILDADADITDLIKTFFQEGGMPAGILKSKQRLTEEQVERIRQRWRERYGGWRQWSVPAVLDADAEYQRVQNTFEEMQFGDIDARIESRVCAVLGVPPILVGAKVGLDRSTYANYEQARKSWWQDTLVPLYMSLQDNIQNQVAAEFGPNVRVEWDFSRVPALQEDESLRWNRWLDAVKAGVVSVNEFRQALGLPPVEGGDAFLRSLQQIEVSAVPETKAVAPDPEIQKRLRSLEVATKKALEKEFDRLTQSLLEEVGRGE